MTATIDGKRVDMPAGGHPSIVVPSGRHVIVVTAADDAGNTATKSRTLVVNVGPPRISATDALFSNHRTSPVTVSVVAGDSTLSRVRIDGVAIAHVGGGRFLVTTGRRHLIDATTADGTTTRLVVTIQPLRALRLFRDRALDGARGDQLWYDSRIQTGVRLSFLRQVEQRLVLLGYIPSADPTRYTPALLHVVKTFQVRYGCSGPGRSSWGTIGPCTTAKLDALAVRASRIWRSGKR
jgi:hypothetical protein